MVYRYGKLIDGDFCGDIISVTTPWKDHIANKMISARTALPIVTEEKIPEHSEYYLRTGPVYTVGDETITEKYEWVIIPDINKIFRSKIDTIRLEKRARGLTWEFKEGEDIIQLRDDTDLQNLQGLVSSAHIKETSGIEDAIIVLRGESDINHFLTPKEMIIIGQAIESYVGSLYAHAWGLKDQIGESNDLELCLALDIESGWPTN